MIDIWDTTFDKEFDEAVEALGKRERGKWLKTGQSFVYPDKFRNYFCSVCGFELDTHIRQEPNYCPNCGAKMNDYNEQTSQGHWSMVQKK